MTEHPEPAAVLASQPDHPGPAGVDVGEPAPPAGWYPDPSGTPQARYWSGKEWTWSTGTADKYAPRSGRWWTWFRPLSDDPAGPWNAVLYAMGSIAFAALAQRAPSDDRWYSAFFSGFVSFAALTAGLACLLNRSGRWVLTATGWFAVASGAVALAWSLVLLLS